MAHWDPIVVRAPVLSGEMTDVLIRMEDGRVIGSLTCPSNVADALAGSIVDLMTHRIEQETKH